MARDIAVSLIDVTKKYRLFASPAERLKESLHPFRKNYHKEFWALKGISLDIAKGEGLGILGRNGCGKSTLLQIMASVLRPTSGTVTVNGRVSALLELGAGFNPEFTGRQNVLLNGTLMGLSHNEMLNRMPEIIEFADIGEFFEQPIKTYSSGMFLRVAFAAAVHVSADVIIIDEALAVGDAKFQHKCFQRLSDLQTEAKTVIFVTHNSSLVTSYCGRAILLDGGELITSGEPAHVIDRYYDLLFEDSTKSRALRNAQSAETIPSNVEVAPTLGDVFDSSSPEDLCHTRQGYNKHEVRFGSGEAKIIDYVIESDGQRDVAILRFRAKVDLYVKVLFHRSIRSPVLGFAVKTLEGVEIFGTNTYQMGEKLQSVTAGQLQVYKFSFSLSVNPSDYFFDIGVAQVDGTRGGAVLDVRRSVAHCVVLLETERAFDGLFDLAPNFEVLT